MASLDFGALYRSIDEREGARYFFASKSFSAHASICLFALIGCLGYEEFWKVLEKARSFLPGL